MAGPERLRLRYVSAASRLCRRTTLPQGRLVTGESRARDVDSKYSDPIDVGVVITVHPAPRRGNRDCCFVAGVPACAKHTHDVRVPPATAAEGTYIPQESPLITACRSRPSK